MNFDLPAPDLDLLDLPALDLDGPVSNGVRRDATPISSIRIARPFKKELDWFVVDWEEVFPRTGFAPNTLPGVRTMNDHPVAMLAPRTAKEYAQQAGASAFAPYSFKVHISHLPPLGYVPWAPIMEEIDALIAAHGEHKFSKILRPHQVRGVQFIQARRGVLLADEMRCIAGDAEISYNRAGVTRRATLTTFYDRFHSGLWRTDIPTRIRSLCDGFFRLHAVINVLDKGTRTVVRLTLKSGRTLRLTPDHEVAISPTEFAPVGALRRGQLVLTNGAAACRECGRSDRRIVTYRYSPNVGRCIGCVQREVNLTGRHPNATGKHKHSDGYIQVSGLRGHPRADHHGYVFEHILVAERKLGRSIRPDEEVHHLNHVRDDNRPENLAVMSVYDHHAEHGRKGGYAHLDGGSTINGGTVHFIPKTDEVVDVVEDGEAHVYDVVCAEPYRNFVANGVVVHNCGKTVTTHYAHEPETGPLVVVGPVAARAIHHEWAARRYGACADAIEIARTAATSKRKRECSICVRIGAKIDQSGTASFASLDGLTPDLSLLSCGTRVLFLTYATVSAWSEQFLAFGKVGTLALDEIHLAGIQSRKNETFIGLKRLSTCAYRRIALSGSPMWNKPNGLWTLLDLICPAAFGDYWPFCQRYAAAHPTEHGWVADGVTNERELELRLSAIMLRRTWAEISPGLPPISRTIEYVPLSDEEHAAVFETAAELRKAAEAGQKQTVVGNKERLRKLYAKQKVKRAVELIKESLANGQSLVVWTAHHEVAKDISDAFGSEPCVYGPINGKMRPTARDQVLDEVRADPNPRFLIATMGSLATAVSLNWAQHAINVELDWTPAVHLQADMRIFDGTRQVSITYLVAECQSDREVADTVLAKLAVSSALNLKAGTGDVAEVLSKAFGVSTSATLNDVAALILSSET